MANMNVLILFIALLQLSIAQVQTNECVLTSNDDIQLTTDQFFQSRQLCTTSNFPVKNVHRVAITGRLVDYVARCKKSINHANIEIIHVQSNSRQICYELYHPNPYGYFNLSSIVRTPFTKQIILRVTTPGYKTVQKEIPVPLSQERLGDTVLNWQIALTVDRGEVQPVNVERMNSVVDTLLSEMTIDEKIGQLNLVAVGFDTTGPIVSQNVTEKIRRGEVGSVLNTYTPKAVRQLQGLAVNSSRLKIPLIFGYDVIHGHKTIFPVPLGLSATWDMALIELSAHIAAKEASADALNWVYSPMVDIARDPRWGRIMEGAGEDPWLGSQIAAAMVRGYQGNNLSRSNYSHVMS